MERTEHNPDLRSNGGRKTPRSGHKVRQTAFFLGELGKVSQSIRVWRMLVAEAWPRTPRKEGLLGGSSDDWGCPLGAHSAQASWGPAVCPGPPRGQHIRRPFRHLWAHHRPPTLEMRLWKNIFSRQSSVGTYSF